jgi:hypothetical protein
LAGGTAATTPVWAEVPVPAPDEFDAVTTTRSVKPISADVRRYVEAFAPAMSTQLAPELLQALH